MARRLLSSIEPSEPRKSESGAHDSEDRRVSEPVKSPGPPVK